MKNFYALKDNYTIGGLPKLLTDEESIKNMVYNNDVDKYTPLKSFRKGSVVRLVDKRPSHWNSYGEMDKFLGGTMIIEKFNHIEVVFQNVTRWVFYANSIAEVIKY